MFNATMLAENRHTVLRRPLDALKIKNFRTFTFTELVDVQAAADILTHDIMPIVRMTRRVAWPSLCDAMAEWMVQFETTRARVLRIERTSWRQHEQIYKDNVLGVCLRMRWAREVWIRAHFDRLCKQFQVETAVDLSCALRACMEKDDSIVYCGFSFTSKRPYYGMVHNRAPHQRWQEHWRAILQHGSGMAIEKEQKYMFMSQHGGAAKWHFLPYITCGQVIPVLKLKTLESRIIGMYPNSLNRMKFPRALHSSVQVGKRSLHVHDRGRDNRIAGRGNDTSVQMTVYACNADGSSKQ